MEDLEAYLGVAGAMIVPRGRVDSSWAHAPAGGQSTRGPQKDDR